MSKADGTKIAIKFTEELIDDVAGNEQAFIIRGKEYNYVPNGTLIDKTYHLASVERHPTEEKTILLTVVPNNKFESAVGMLTVSYDAAKGSLRGRAGLVSTFSEPFVPEGLCPKPDQNDETHIEVSVAAEGMMTEIFYTDSLPDMGHVEVASITALGALVHINNL